MRTMETRMRGTMRMMAAVLILGGCEATGGADGTTALVPGSLEGLASASLESDLPYLREEEKLARDVYRVLGDAWGLAVFRNIESSEQTHTSRVRDLMAALVVPDPVADDATGAFVDPTLAALYGDLVAAGSASEVEALRVGASIEDLDIADLREKAARTDVPEVLAVYAALECGSRNHLRAFTARLAEAGAPWAPTFLEADEAAAIAASPREKCGS